MKTLLVCAWLLCSLLPLCAEEPTTVSLTPRWTSSLFGGVAEIEGAVLDCVNAERARAKLPPVTASATLQVAARQHSAEMGARQYFSHLSPIAEWKLPWQRTYCAGYWGQQVGENILMADLPANTTVAGVAPYFHQLWMDSPPHRANILEPKWTQLGVGVVRVGKAYYATQLFAVPLAELQEATLSAATGELVRLRLVGTLRTVNITAFVDGVEVQCITPKSGRWMADLDCPRDGRMHEVLLVVGTQQYWRAQLDGKSGAVKQAVHCGRTRIVEQATTQCVPFTGMRLQARVRVPRGQAISIVLDRQNLTVLTPDAHGEVAIALLLPARATHYIVGMAVGTVMEDLLFIDTTRPLTEAFRGRPE